MAWTAPRTWVTSEVVTAAVMNTHVRDNFNTTAPSKVSTAGDLVVATGANALARLGVGGVAAFLGSDGSTPAWTNTLGDATTSGVLKLRGPNPQLQINDEGTTDAADYWVWRGGDDTLLLEWHDDSDADYQSMQLSPKDYVLHTGANGVGEGAVVIEVDTASSGNLTTSGTIICDVTGVATGGPAFVMGWWTLNLSVQSGTPTGYINILPRNDGSNLPTGPFAANDYQLSRVGLTANERWFMSGHWYQRHTSGDTSDYELFGVAETNGEWTVEGGNMTVMSIQYPT